MAALLQVGRRFAPVVPQPWQALRGPATTPQPLRLLVTYRCSLLSALLVAMPWVKPCAVAVTIEQCRAWAACGARLKAAITLTATAATSNLLMALSSLQLKLCAGVSIPKHANDGGHTIHSDDTHS